MERLGSGLPEGQERLDEVGPNLAGDERGPAGDERTVLSPRPSRVFGDLQDVESEALGEDLLAGRSEFVVGDSI